jgi:succinyl-CoA synthetase beta subunit
MRLLEFQAKQILRENGIAVPAGSLVTTSDDLNNLKLPVVLKAQVPVGGRGKAGAVKKVDQLSDAEQVAREILARTVKGYPVQALLAEEAVDVQQELYISLLTDKQVNMPLLMSSAAGGIDIEEVARQAPERIKKQHLDPMVGIQDFVLRALVKSLGVEDRNTLGSVVQKLWDIARKMDTTLIEINPLAATPQGLVALDAKILLDDKAAYRHPDLFSRIEAEQKNLNKRPRSGPEKMAAERRINYIPLEGDIGMIADGAGTGMLTMDMIHDAGGRPANFCEMGGMANTKIMQSTMEVVLDDKRLKCLIISLIGGLTRMDEMAAGIVNYLEQHGRSVPVVVRMCGTKAEVGLPMLQKAGVDTYEDLDQSVRMAVARAREL